MQQINIGIIGMGGVGGYYGGQLAHFYQDDPAIQLSFIARGTHLAAIQQAGLQVVTDSTSFIAHPQQAHQDLTTLKGHQILIICVKSYDLVKIAQELQDIVDENTLILPLLNGVSASEVLRAHLPKAKVLDACVYVTSYVSKAGEVTQYGKFDQIWFGNQEGAYQEECQKLEKLLVTAGIKAAFDEQIIEKIWNKYLLISAMASVTSAERATMGQLMENESTQQLLIGVMQEVKALADAKKIGLAKDIVETTFERFKKFDYDAKSSMLLDFERGKKTELEFLTGYVVKTAAEYGLNTPVTSQLYEVLLEG